MRRLIIIALLFSITAAAQAQQQNKATYYLIRHAEKDRSNCNNKNPELSKKGIIRAEKWSQIFDELKIDAVYATDYNRTLQTAATTAKNKKLTIKKYHPKNINMVSFIKETNGQSVLIVGHSNTIPNFTNKLIGKNEYLDMDDDDNDNLYLVTIEGDLIEHIKIDVE